jgi:hypothetical protein
MRLKKNKGTHRAHSLFISRIKTQTIPKRASIAAAHTRVQARRTAHGDVRCMKFPISKVCAALINMQMSRSIVISPNEIAHLRFARPPAQSRVFFLCSRALVFLSFVLCAEGFEVVDTLGINCRLSVCCSSPSSPTTRW